MGVVVAVVGCSLVSEEESMIFVGLRGAELVSMAMGFHNEGLVPTVSVRQCVCVCVCVCVVCMCVCVCVCVCVCACVCVCVCVVCMCECVCVCMCVTYTI